MAISNPFSHNVKTLGFFFFVFVALVFFSPPFINRETLYSTQLCILSSDCIGWFFQSIS
jgi:hypothetical protein